MGLRSLVAVASLVGLMLPGCGSSDPSTVSAPATTVDPSDTPAEDSGDECDHGTHEGDDILGTLDRDGRFDYVICMIEAGSRGVQYFTTGDRRLFAPTDEVFEALGEDALTGLATGASEPAVAIQIAIEIDGAPVQVRAILDHHILGCSPNVGASSCPEAPPDTELRTGEYVNAAGATIDVMASPAGLRAGDAEMLEQIEASNGVIYVVNGFVSLP